ncbi:sugar-binding domain-containing protein [Flavivirga algicola]|uniref:Beta-galactosidase n=1 Tax=Flavivirga algicola TaxID=2729136 RepID=A0ABX1RUL7_9FLAO|nr:sugar-binding domain-containing protein [Flavivirga algicola]NMH86871.1 hypothetical protein [Flavivirga algicola]
MKLFLSKYRIYILATLVIIWGNIACTEVQESNEIDLSGEWLVKLDPKDEGISKNWFLTDFVDTINLPGCLQEQGHGEKPGPNTKWWAPLNISERHPSLDKYAKSNDDFKLIQFLMPRHHYIGAAWFSKEIEIPESFNGKNKTLFLERCHWESKVWIDGKPIGSNTSLATPHKYSLNQLKPGKYKLVIRIDNSEIYKIGRMPHSVSDQTQGTWNGIVGDIKINAEDKISIASIKTIPDIKNKSVAILVSIENASRLKGNFIINLDALGYNAQNNHDPLVIEKKGNLTGGTIQNLTINYALGKDMKLWSEFEPNLYKLKVDLLTKTNQADYHDNKEISFGMRDITTDGKHFYVNGIKTFLRGNVDCAVYPKTGYAPMSVKEWKRVMQTHKDFGLNFIRYHSWCPPKQAFIAADELGLYLAPEVHEWSWVTKPEVHQFFKDESDKMLSYFANHPSFVMMGLGNESGIEKEIADDLIQQWKDTDTSRLYTVKASIAKNQGVPGDMDFEVVSHIKDESFDRGRGRTRYQAFWPPTPENSLFTAESPQTTIDWDTSISLYNSKFNNPIISHELAQFCAYPDVFNEIKKYKGYLRPTYLEIAADQLKERGLVGQLPNFIHDSGKWQVQLTKEEIEAAFRSGEMAGFQWLSLNDFTGQNTAPVGFTDAFFENKSYVDSKEMQAFCGPSVLLARLPRRVFTTSEVFSAEFEISHYGNQDLDLSDLKMLITDEAGSTIISKSFPSKAFVNKGLQKIDEFQMDLLNMAPSKYNLQLESKKNGLSNNWDFWIYPNSQIEKFPSSVKVTNTWDANTLKLLKSGKTVLLLPKIGTLKGNLPGCFTTFYWTSFGEKGGQSSANGITMNPNHPLFNEFKTDSHTNWNWWDLLTQCQPMILDAFNEKKPWPIDYKPIIQPIDSWKLNRKLGLVVEAKMGKGKLLICSIDLENNLEERPVAKQFRRSLVKYITSKTFNPETEISVSQITALFDQSNPENAESMQGLPDEG